MKVFFVGDVVGAPGRDVFSKLVPGMKARGEVDAAVVNAENVAGGSGITEKIAEELFSLGADVITLGDHAWDRKEIYGYLSKHPRILRPANYSKLAPGKGSCCAQIRDGLTLGVMVLVGRTFMKYQADCPFMALDTLSGELRQQTQVIIVDMHAEATSEKMAMGWHADGKVSGVIGTHTHIQTADEKVLPKGTAYLTDAGMTGPYDSVIGQAKETIIERYLTGMPSKFEVVHSKATLCGAILDIDENSGRARSIRRIQLEDQV